MSFAYTPFKSGLMSGAYGNLGAADVRVLLVMTNTTADTDQDVANVADIGTLDEMDGANYVRKALGAETVTEDDPNNRGEFSSTTPVTWTALGAGTRSIAGMVMFVFVTVDADHLLMAYIDTGGFPIAANGGDLSVAMNAEGWIQTT